MESLPADPLLKPGAFIDPTTPNGFARPEPAPDVPTSSKDTDPKTPGNQTGSDSALSEMPDWLPPGWRLEFRVRTSGATVGQKDKYYYDPVSNRRFRSKKEVLSFLETGSVKKKNAGSDAETTPGSSKRRKNASKVSIENFKFDDVPGKVKWELTDIYEGLWTPLVDGANRVPESSKQEWAAAFRYLSLQKNGKATAS